MSSARTKGPGEVFCRSCGTPIKEEAELCPNCGVRNEYAGPFSSRGPAPERQTTTHDPSGYETTVGDRWYLVVLLPSIFTIPSLAVMFLASTDVTALFLPLGFLFLACVVLPIMGVYFDRQYVRANSKWHPSALWMVVLFLFYPINVFVAMLYLYRRREVLDEP